VGVQGMSEWSLGGGAEREIGKHSSGVFQDGRRRPLDPPHTLYTTARMRRARAFLALTHRATMIYYETPRPQPPVFSPLFVSVYVRVCVLLAFVPFLRATTDLAGGYPLADDHRLPGIRAGSTTGSRDVYVDDGVPPVVAAFLGG